VVILLPGDTDSPEEHPIYARSGWRIPQEYPSGLSAELMRIKTDAHVGWRRNIEPRSLSTYPYNCIGMIFASRRAWIEIEHIYKILYEDGYRQIVRREIMSGDVVLYKDDNGEPSHVALITMVEFVGETPNILVISKWGKEAEFIHHVENVPTLFGHPAEFWTDRV
jgi:hypothetical protein